VESQLSALTVRGNGSLSDYHSLRLQFNRRLSKGCSAHSYTYSHSTDSGSADLDRTVPGSIANLTVDHASSDYDVRHAFSAALTYNIPAPDWGSFAKALLRNWSFNTIFFARSATPFGLTADEQQSTTLYRVTFARRPNIVAGAPFFIEDSTAPGGKRVNPSAFAFPAATTAQGIVANAPEVLAWQADIDFIVTSTSMIAYC
jgi:hypothetical protein